MQALREGVNLALEEGRSNEEIGSSLEAAIIIVPSAQDWDFLAGLKPGELAALFLVSQVELVRPAEESALRPALSCVGGAGDR